MLKFDKKGGIILYQNQTISMINTEINKCSKHPNAYSKRERKYLSTILQNDEEIKCIFKYKETENGVSLSNCVCTNKRLIFFSANMYSHSHLFINLEKITSISIKSTYIDHSTIDIYYEGRSKIIYNVGNANNLVSKINSEIDNFQTIKIQTTQITEENFIDQISRLADLYKEGIITEYEFSIKKQELLNNLNNN